MKMPKNFYGIFPSPQPISVSNEKILDSYYKRSV